MATSHRVPGADVGFRRGHSKLQFGNRLQSGKLCRAPRLNYGGTPSYPPIWRYGGLTHSIRTHATLTDKILMGVEEYFPEDKVERVRQSMQWVCDDREFEKEWDTGKQVATSYIEGLTAKAFHDAETSELDFKWWLELEEHADVIKDEFLKVTQDKEKLEKGNSIWVPAVDAAALDYGNEWRTLVLQDRGRWDPDNTKLFPKTTRIIKKSNAPSLEVFFARQPGGTGIKPHTDNSNFIMTGHLALVVPEGNCWIKCGNEVKKWETGKSMIMDTSFIHSTANETESDRYVLIIRFWHPEVTKMEKLAMQFVFDSIDSQDVKVAKKKLKKAYKAMGYRKRI